MKIPVALLYGGASSEYEVSCRSAASILSHLDRKKFHILPIGITKEGYWYAQPQLELRELENIPEVLPVDSVAEQRITLVPGLGLERGGNLIPLKAVFNIVHGQTGEDGQIQGLLALAGLPGTGAGVLGSALGMDKAMVKQVWIYNDLPVVPFLQVKKHQLPDPESILNFFTLATNLYSLPVFVKPANAGSSVGVSKVTSFEAFHKALEAAFAVDSKLLVEPAIDAREIEVAVLGTDHPQAFTPGEILPQHEFYDYDAKYQDPNGALFRLPAQLPLEELETLKSLAVKAYLSAECQGLARVDFFLDRNTGEFLLNEINTLPGFTSISMFPMMAAHDGMSYSDLLTAIIDEALTRG